MMTDLGQTVRLFQANTIFAVPSLTTLLRLQKLPTLTVLVAGGEVLSKYAIDNFAYDAPRKAGEPQRTIHNIYGPTEATLSVCAETPSVKSRGSTMGDPLAPARLSLSTLTAISLRRYPFPSLGSSPLAGHRST